MKNFVFAVCILACIISLTQSRPSYYYSNKDSSGYHPPYDFIDYNNNGDSACSPLCSPSTEVIQTNNNYTQVNSGQCNNNPDFFSQQNQLPGLSFGSCCSYYQTCAQTCGNTKEFCDQQFYGCIWSQCGYDYRVRPADRIICRSYATCYASYTANNMTCEQFNYYQSQACVCVPTGNVVPLPSSSSTPGSPSVSPAPGNPSASSSPTSFSSSPAPSSATISSSASVSPSFGSSLSSSPLPVGKRQVTSSTESASSTGSSSAGGSSSMNNNGNNNSNNNMGYSNGNYVSRVVPAWSSVYSQCPPDIGNYINVMSDQEMDDISMWNSQYGAGSSLKTWWDLF